MNKIIIIIFFFAFEIKCMYIENQGNENEIDELIKIVFTNESNILIKSEDTLAKNDKSYFKNKLIFHYNIGSCFIGQNVFFFIDDNNFEDKNIGIISYNIKEKSHSIYISSFCINKNLQNKKLGSLCFSLFLIYIFNKYKYVEDISLVDYSQINGNDIDFYSKFLFKKENEFDMILKRVDFEKNRNLYDSIIDKSKKFIENNNHENKNIVLNQLLSYVEN